VFPVLKPPTALGGFTRFLAVSPPHNHCQGRATRVMVQPMPNTLGSFLEANAVDNPDQVRAMYAVDATDGFITNDMLLNWTFDGAIVPDRHELLAWLTESV
jgi:hypothetical protein